MSLATRISTEEVARANGDASVIVLMNAADASIAANLSTEIADRIAAVSGEASLRVAADASISLVMSTADASLATAISTEQNRAETAEMSLATRLSTEESVRAAADTALSNNKYDKTGGLISGNVWVSNNVNVSGSMVVADGFSAGGWTELPGAIFDPSGPIDFMPGNGVMNIDVSNGVLNINGNMNVVGNINAQNIVGVDLTLSGLATMQYGMQVTGSAEFGGNVVMGGVNVKPVVTVVETSGAGDYEDIATMFDDLAGFSGMVMANFQVVADGGFKGMAGEYRVSAQCNGGQLLVLSVVELAQDLLGGAMLDVNFLTDGKVRVMNDGQESGTYKWHVQRVKMVAVNTSGAVK